MKQGNNQCLQSNLKKLPYQTLRSTHVYLAAATSSAHDFSNEFSCAFNNQIRASVLSTTPIKAREFELWSVTWFSTEDSVQLKLKT